jgi:hypothetical protein
MSGSDLITMVIDGFCGAERLARYRKIRIRVVREEVWADDFGSGACTVMVVLHNLVHVRPTLTPMCKRGEETGVPPGAESAALRMSASEPDIPTSFCLDGAQATESP